MGIGDFYYNQDVPAGGSYRRTNSVTLPMSANGSYTLFVQVDFYNSIYEANLGNKVSSGVSGTFTLTPPDLMPLSVAAPATFASANPNPEVQVAWGVTNRGIGSASGGWYDRVWFSTNGILDGLSLNIGTFYFNQEVPVGGGYSQTNPVTLPMTASGSYTLFVQVDNYNYVFESNETNNILAGVTGSFTLAPMSFNVSSEAMHWTNGGFQMQLDGLHGGGPVIIYASSNLTSWLPIYTNPSAIGSIWFLDSSATNFPLRFYRAVEQ